MICCWVAVTMSSNLFGNSFDLNFVPDEAHANDELNLALSLAPGSVAAVDPPSLHPAQTTPPAVCYLVIDVDASDDDVELIPPPTVQSQSRDQARRRFRRNRETILIEDVESNHRTSENFLGSSLGGDIGAVVPTTSNQMIVGNAECSIDSSAKYLTLGLHPSKSLELSNSEQEEEKQNEPSFECPICLKSLVDPSSTICGHIFCQVCITKAVKQSKRCPTCRTKLNKNKFHRVFLPTAD